MGDGMGEACCSHSLLATPKVAATTERGRAVRAVVAGIPRHAVDRLSDEGGSPAFETFRAKIRSAEDGPTPQKQTRGYNESKATKSASAGG